MIYSQKLKDRFENLLQRRSEDRKRKKEQFSTRKTIQGKSDKEKPQSKVKESKVNTLKEYSEKEFLADWNELRKKHLDKPSFLNKITGQDLENFKDLQKDYNREDFRYALIGLFKQKKLPNNNTTMQSNPKHFLTYFNAYLTAYHDKNRELYGKLEKETV